MAANRRRKSTTNGSAVNGSNGGGPLGPGLLDAPRVRLLDLDTSEGPEIELPTGRAVRVRVFDAMHYQLWLDVQRTQDDADGWRLLTYALPDVDERELAMLSAPMMWFVVQAAARRADLILSVLRKNASRPLPPPAAAAAPYPPRPSTPSTTSSTPSPASPSTSAAGGGP